MKNKKVAAIITASALAIATLGTTFAWWTANASSKTEITMGNLKIEASFDDLDADVYEPGQTVEVNGTIKNTGSIWAVLHIENGTQISFAYADDNFTEWTGEKWVDDTEGAVISSLDGNEALKLDGDGTVLWAWFYNRNDTNDRYLMLAPGTELEVTVDYEFAGSIMTNKYMDAKLRATSDIDATQTFDDAMMDLFGLDFKDLGLVIDLGTARTAVPESVLQQIREIFHQE